MGRKRLATIVAVALAVGLLAGGGYLIRQTYFGPRTISAIFTSATGIYPGDEVRVSGVKVGRIDSITPEARRPGWCSAWTAMCRYRSTPRP